MKPQQQKSISSSSGRKEKFDTDRMAQTIGRSGVPFLMARDIEKKVFNLIPTLSIIGNVSKSTGILIVNGEKDSDTQA